MPEQVDVQTEIARLWSEMAMVNARIEATGSGRSLTAAEVNALMTGTRSATRVAQGVLQGYRRLYRVAAPIRDGLRRECDHLVYEGNTEAADELRDDLGDDEMLLGDFLFADDEP